MKLITIILTLLLLGSCTNNICSGKYRVTQIVETGSAPQYRMYIGYGQSILTDSVHAIGDTILIGY